MALDRKVSRRAFLRGSGNVALGVGLGSAFPAIVTGSAWGAAPVSGRVRIGCIGVGNQGRVNMRAFLGDVVAVCDVDQGRLAAAKAEVEKATGRSCAAFGDYRKLLESRDVDAVVITTPDHWHALQTVHACEAG